MSPFDLSNYEPVEDRLRAFWTEYPNGRVSTKLERADDAGYIVFAAIWRDVVDPHPASTGLASESVTERGVNSTSALENCETSAIGRALANLGYAPKGARPSREEMSKASRRPSDSGTTSHPRVAQTDRAPVPTTPKHSPSVPESATSAPAVIGSAGTAESGSGVAEDNGEGSEAAPDPGQLPHEAVWIQSPKVKSMVVCEVPRCVLHPARRKDETTVPA